MRSRSFDLIVLCHSLSDDECEQLVRLANQQNPRPLVLAMSPSSRANRKVRADKQLGVDAGPYGLVKKCAEMVGFVLKSKARAAHTERGAA